MNFSASAVATLWLTISAADAFTASSPSSLQSSSKRHSSQHVSQLPMLLKQDKFDAVISTKRNKDLGYDARSGRFFELQDSNGSSYTSATATLLDEPVTAIEDAAQDDSTPVQIEAQEQVIDDIPPMPEDGFVGMNITGEINGVKMTSSKDTLKRKQITEEDDNEIEMEDDITTTQSLDDIQPTGKNTLSDRITNSGAVSAAAMATAAVNAAVSMKSLTAPSTDKSYISLDSESKITDEEGLPLVYDKDLIETYWKKERGALNQRWSYFVGKAVPFLTKHIPGLSRRARIDLQDLGPTFIKAGQMMSVRPDVLPQVTLDELTKLQDSVVPFDTEIAVKQIEEELGGPLGQFFTSISEEPVAAASLAQVYLATLADGKDTKVAVKVQRPSVLATVSKDLYVLRRAAEVFQGLVDRFAPQQKTNYVALLNEWSIGFYTELDFANEGRNQERLRTSLIDAGIEGITVPKVYDDMCTRRLLVSEWMDGKKLSECPPEEIKEVTAIAQEAFLTQLFEFGFFHGR